MKFYGFLGYTIGTGLAMYLIENAVMLEKVIVEQATEFSHNFKITNHEKLTATKQSAKVPPGTELNMIY